jgi:hypothetical protein
MADLVAVDRPDIAVLELNHGLLLSAILAYLLTPSKRIAGLDREDKCLVGYRGKAIQMAHLSASPRLGFSV